MAIQDKCKGFGTLSYLLKKCLVEKHLSCLYDDINLADLAHRPVDGKANITGTRQQMRSATTRLGSSPNNRLPTRSNTSLLTLRCAVRAVM